MYAKYQHYTLAAIIGFLGCCFLVHLPSVNPNSNNDLQTRVFGAKYALAHHNAYTYAWRVEDNIDLYSPATTRQQVINGNTVTPFVLLLTASLTSLPLGITSLLWYTLSYLLLSICIIMVASKLLLKPSIANIILLLVVTSFPLLSSWQLHCNSGQTYILYTVLATTCLYFYHKNKLLLAAILAGILTACRLPMLLLFVPIVLYKKNTTVLLPYFITLAVCIVLPIIIFNPLIWQQYFSAMHVYELELYNQIPTSSQAYIPNFSFKNLNLASTYIPITKVLLPTVQSDIFSIQKLLYLLHLPSNSSNLYTLYTCTAIFLFLIIYRVNPLFIYSLPLFLLFFALLVLLFDYFVPAPRFGYNFVQYFYVIAVIVIFKIRFTNFGKILLGVGVLLLIIRVQVIPESYSLGELLCLTAVVHTMAYNKQTNNKNEIFQYNWLGNLLLGSMGLFSKMGIYRNPRKVPYRF